MKLQNGFTLDGVINTPSMVNINNTWQNILIIETTIGTDQARVMFENNSLIIDITTDNEIRYFTDGLLDVKIDNGKTYVWLNYVSSAVIPLLQPQITALQKQLTDVTTALASLVGGV
jgi:hypothetical protein